MARIHADSVQVQAVKSNTIGSLAVNTKYDTWVVGSGVLGTHILSQLSSQCNGSQLVAETKSDARKVEIESMGVHHKIRDQRTEEDNGSARNVIICLPPSCSSSYSEEVRAATRLWAGKAGGGNLVYTSSIGVYGEAVGCTITEMSHVDTSSLNPSRSVLAEQVVLERGGSVIRLAGLYTASRGPHAYWLERTRNAAASTVQSGSSASLVNLIHYEDAAAATVAVMKATDLRGSVFLACDNEPVSREEICKSALSSGLYDNCSLPVFASSETTQSKVCNSSLTRKLLGWEPRHSSFRVFMRRLGGEVVPDAPHQYSIPPGST